MSSLVIGIVGGSGSGKTTVARAIQEAIAEPVAFVDQDAYYKDLSHLQIDERARVNFDHPDAIDTDLMVNQLTQLIAGHAIDKPTYDFARHTRAERVERIEPAPVIIIDGILLFAEARIRELCNLKLFVDVADDIRFIRRLERDVLERGRSMEGVILQYLTTVRPMHLEFVEPSKRYADVILPEGGRNRIAIEMVVAGIASHESRVARP